MIDKLEFIIALAREKHFGRAAEACGVTQPTLSAGVKQLEDQMGVLLVNRGSRFQGFTPEGQRVLEWARRIVGDSRNMRDEINSLRRGLSGAARRRVILGERGACGEREQAGGGQQDGALHNDLPRVCEASSLHRVTLS